MKDGKVAKVPFGIPPISLLAYYVLVSALTGNLMAATESLKELMRLGGVFGHLDSYQQELALIEVTARGLSMSIVFAFFGGIINDFIGPKVTAVLGQACCAIGFFLIFFSDPADMTRIKFGCCFIGSSYSCVTISHTSIASLFPGNGTLAITMLCVGVNLSLGVTLIMSAISKYIGVTTIVAAFIITNLVLCVLEGLLVPTIPFCNKSLSESKRHLTELPPIAEEEESKTTNDEIVAANDDEEQLNDMSKSTLMTQVFTYHYWALTAFTSFCFFRRIHYAQLVRLIDEYVASATGASPDVAATCVEWFKRLMPLTMVAAFVTGSITNRVGVIWGMVLVNTYHIILSLLASFEYMWMQYVAIVFYDLCGCFIFGLMYSFLGGFFGFATMGVLQAVLRLVCGGFGELITPWCHKVVFRLPSILQSNMILAGIGVLFYAIPLSLVYYPLGGFARARRIKKKQAEKGITQSTKESIVTLSARSRLRQSVALFGAEVVGDVHKRQSDYTQPSAQRVSLSRRGLSQPNYMSFV
eukprot:CAMPEP_0113844188 /NCGR_PEP_ID=MMETSP0372-20130328/112_1 /TAXON_ID=340204 /ORGANISM="Lankesteria abbotti" /LENGTH=526 /DNA_ID=CAMNT_0000813191 /DNA_START=71 /DNA_END=1651 /DNA_ORIENTATION=- /assembly_acc=CAM_ASM_000359